MIKINTLTDIKLSDVLEPASAGCGIGVSCYDVYDLGTQVAIVVVVGPAACQVSEQWALERDQCDGEMRAAGNKP